MQKVFFFSLLDNRLFKPNYPRKIRNAFYIGRYLPKDVLEKAHHSEIIGVKAQIDFKLNFSNFIR